MSVEFIVGGPGSSQLDQWFEAVEIVSRARSRNDEAEIVAAELLISRVQPGIDRLNAFLATSGLAGLVGELEDWAENASVFEIIRLDDGERLHRVATRLRVGDEASAILFRLTFDDRYDIWIPEVTPKPSSEAKYL